MLVHFVFPGSHGIVGKQMRSLKLYLNEESQINFFRIAIGDSFDKRTKPFVIALRRKLSFRALFALPDMLSGRMDL